MDNILQYLLNSRLVHGIIHAVDTPEKSTLTQLREMMGLKPGQLTSSEKEELAINSRDNLMRSYGKILAEHEDEVLKALKNTRDELIDQVYLKPTPAGITAKYLTDRWAGSISKLSLSDLGRNDVLNFTLYHDLAYGMEIVGLTVGLADRARAMQPDQMAKTIRPESIYYQSMKTQIEFTKPFLDEDHGAGFVLADSVAQVMRGKIQSSISFMLPSLIPEFVIAGAEAGAFVYKKVYPHAKAVVIS